MVSPNTIPFHSRIPDTTTILIVDDDEATRILLRAAIIPWGYKVVEAKDGEEAWEILQQANPPSILILDWLMPKLDGISLCKRIEERLDFHPYIIFVTRMSGAENVIQGLEAGADEFLLKPFDLTELRIRIFAGERILQYRTQMLAQEKEIRAYVEKMQELAQNYAKKLVPHADLIHILQDADLTFMQVVDALQTDKEKNVAVLKQIQELQNKLTNISNVIKNIFAETPIIKPASKNKVIPLVTQHVPAISTTPSKKTSKLIDMKRMQAFFGNDTAAIHDFIKTFIHLAEDQLKQIATAIQNKDIETGQYYFHLLGGAAGNSGIMKMFKWCETGEQKILIPDWDGVKECYEKLQEIVKKLKGG